MRQDLQERLATEYWKSGKDSLPFDASANKQVLTK
jgi:hypothetical protein